MKMSLTPFPSSLAGTRHHVLDHLHQPHFHAVVGVVDALDAVGFELADFLGRDGAAAAGEYLAKHSEWGADGKMAEYLRPGTLFAKKNFWNYEGRVSASPSPHSGIFAGAL